MIFGLFKLYYLWKSAGASPANGKHFFFLYATLVSSITFVFAMHVVMHYAFCLNLSTVFHISKFCITAAFLLLHVPNDLITIFRV